MRAQNFVAYYIHNHKIIGASAMGKLAAPIIINKAMQHNLMPRKHDLLNQRVTLDDIRNRL